MKKRGFQTIVLIIFGVLAAIGLIVFSVSGSPGDQKEGTIFGEVVIWGTLPKETFTSV